jgi:hypothetical protein
MRASGGCEGIWSRRLEGNTDLQWSRDIQGEIDFFRWSRRRNGRNDVLHWTHELVAPSWKGLDKARAVRLVPQGSPKNGDTVRQAVFANKGVRPAGSNESVLFYNLIRMSKKVDE